MSTTGPADALDPARSWVPYQPRPDRPWTLARAAHLLRRAGFGPSWAELQRALDEGPQRTVRRLLTRQPEADAFDREMDECERPGGRAAPLDQLRAWRLRRILGTRHALTEKMTLLWQGWLGVRLERVGDPTAALDHVHRLRAHALGTLHDLIQGASLHPALFLATQPAPAARTRPHENLARHILEQHTVGRGAFAESDVLALTRALRGWTVARGALRPVERERDRDAKTILGQTGPWTERDALRILIAHPATARRVAAALYRWFVSEIEPPAELLVPLADSLRRHRSVAATLEIILSSELFFAPVSHRRVVKSPVQFAAGLLRALERDAAGERLARDLARLGQDLHGPPTRAGWPSGPAWINRAAILGRAELAHALLQGGAGYGPRLDPLALAARHGRPEPRDAGAFVVDLLLGDELPPETRATLDPSPFDEPSRDPADRLRRLCVAIASLPEFQLA